MADIRHTRLANVLVNYSTRVQPGDLVLINTSTPAIPLANEVVKAVLAAGGNPFTLVEDDGLHETFMRHASKEQLAYVTPFEEMMVEKVDCMIRLDAPDNTRALTSLDPKKHQVRQVARMELGRIWSERSASGKFRWVITQFPTQALAQDASMSLGEFEDFLFGATYADKEDPIAEWKRISREQQKAVDWLRGHKAIHAVGPHCDLMLSIEGRAFINSDGQKNMPSGEVYTTPVAGSVNGWYETSFPAVTAGRAIEEVRLEFSDGVVTKMTATRNEDFMLSLLETDKGSSQLGEFAIGTNYGIQQFTHSILFDEKIGGTIHIALGRGFPETGGTNDSSIHLDLICDMRQDSEITADGELLYKDGKFVI